MTHYTVRVGSTVYGSRVVGALVATSAWFCLLSSAYGGGSGLNVAIVVNQRDPTSVELGNYYREQRGVPAANLVRLTSWPGGKIRWTRTECSTHLIDPLASALAERGLTNQIDYVLLSMGIPYQVGDTNGVNSTTSVLFYGFKPDQDTSPYGPSCTLPNNATNRYAFSENSFNSARSHGPPASACLTTMITGDTLEAARRVVDQGVVSDNSFPTQTVWLARTSDAARSVRHAAFDNAIFDARIRGAPALVRTNLDSPASLTNILGLQTGLARLTLAKNAFAPGAMADSLTSFGGILFEATGQTNLLAFLAAGAAGSYGTVLEPCNYTAKFPNPENYFYQARGFSLAESYYMSVTHPYQGLIVGEPLASPFARPGALSWLAISDTAMLSGTTNLSLALRAAHPDQPLQQVDLFLDGKFLLTLTNMAPAAGNVLTVTINRKRVHYTVPPDATIKSVASGLVAALNLHTITNTTGVIAYDRGDRIELQTLNPLRSGSSISVSATAAAGAGAAATTWLRAGLDRFLDSKGFACADLAVSGQPAVGDWLQLDVLKTNGIRVSISRTNTTADGALSDLVVALYQNIAAHSELRAVDGVAPEDYGSGQVDNKPLAGFTLRARSPGPTGIGIQLLWSGSPSFAFLPARTNRLDSNIGDLRPRNHLYVAAGTTNLTFSFPLDTTTLADGWHELTAVAYEGSHVRTQTRAPLMVYVANTRLRATIAFLMSDTDVAAEAPLPFLVSANARNARKIELFGTGGLLSAVSNQPSATLTVQGGLLGAGLHPFRAVVTDLSGHQYRTETVSLRLIGTELPFHVEVGGMPPALRWPALPGRLYEVLAAESLDEPFDTLATITPTNRVAKWTDTAPAPPTRYYRVRAAH